MNTFRTEWHPTKKPGDELAHGDVTLTSGSCFADRFGHWLTENKFSVLSNPFGVSFNPLSIHNQLTAAVSGRKPDPQHIVEREGTRVHLDYHSDFRSKNESSVLDQIAVASEKVNSTLKEARWVILTYGTASVFTYRPSGCVVNNCHKMAAGLFQKRLLTVDEIVASFTRMQQLLITANPTLRFLLTVSPVRHIKDTLEGNSLSKAVLRQAVFEIQQKFSEVVYFPAFEIMMDDLRDYRFYREDLIHPSTLAEAYLWEKFGSQFFSDSTRSLVAAWQALRKALLHQPFEADSDHHHRFLQALAHQLQQMASKLPVAGELEVVEQKLYALKNQ